MDRPRELDTSTAARLSKWYCAKRQVSSMFSPIVVLTMFLTMLMRLSMPIWWSFGSGSGSNAVARMLSLGASCNCCNAWRKGHVPFTVFTFTKSFGIMRAMIVWDVHPICINAFRASCASNGIKPILRMTPAYLEAMPTPLKGPKLIANVDFPWALHHMY